MIRSTAIAALLALNASPADACMCDCPRTPWWERLPGGGAVSRIIANARVREADYAFTGYIVGTEEIGIGSLGPDEPQMLGVVYTVKPDRILKGAPASELKVTVPQTSCHGSSVAFRYFRGLAERNDDGDLFDTFTICDCAGRLVFGLHGPLGPPTN